MPKWGDTHNFGRSVQLQQTIGEPPSFHKPRPVYWEWLFFGKTSKIRHFFSHFLLPHGMSFADSNFNLNTQLLGTWSGLSQQVNEDTSLLNNDNLLFSFGSLLAYCYYFGVYDLHAGNLILKNDAVQVIDCEIVFGSPLLPNESLLLPFKDETLLSSGISKILKHINLKQSNQKLLLMRGFIEMLDYIKPRAIDIFFEIEKLPISEVPIRIIYRHTQRYFDFYKQTSESIMHPEELEQLNRNDIPYFFRFINSNEVYYIADDSFSKFKNVPSRKEWHDTNTRLMPPFSKLKDALRIENQLLPNGTLYIAKFLLNLNGPFNATGTDLEVSASDKIQVLTKGRCYKTQSH